MFKWHKITVSKGYSAGWVFWATQILLCSQTQLPLLKGMEVINLKLNHPYTYLSAMVSNLCKRLTMTLFRSFPLYICKQHGFQLCIVKAQHYYLNCSPSSAKAFHSESVNDLFLVKLSIKCIIWCCSHHYLMVCLLSGHVITPSCCGQVISILIKNLYKTKIHWERCWTDTLINYCFCIT